ncbi:HDIG domain-containing protein [Vagococcus sp. BWB3-3]|uniref:HDIG domain-containing protein n=1 Tax=Vagococcus allomyrinae TaxID=2794353 RepID=A0A940SZ68_9ENTE|nr:HDIG domain-containing metalloprotein [Vagococcus allomyrinae]MBP1044113.1 HDIG domain-containing protein [Vagococcus allomyrinae]
MKLDFGSLQKKLGKKYMTGLVIVFGLLCFVLLYNNVRQKAVSIKEGNLASETIRANKTIENKYETDEKRRLAAETVNPEYTYDKDIATKQVELVNQLFTLVSEVKTEVDKEYEAKRSAAKDKATVAPAATEELVAALKKKFESINQDDIAFYQGFPNAFYEGIFKLNEADLKTVREQSVSLVETKMAEPIRSSNLTTVRQKVNDEIQYLNLGSDLQQLIKYVVDKGIVVNEAANDKRTEELKEQAMAKVNPVMIYSGEVIVREGVQIDSRAIQKLELLGLTNREQSIFPLVALIGLILLQIAVLGYLVFHTSELEKQVRFTTFYVLMVLISLIVMKGLQLFQNEALSYVPLIFPAAFTPLVLNLFISRRASIMGALFQTAFSIFVYYDLIGTSTLLLIVLTYMFTGLMATLIKRERIGRQLGAAALWIIVFPMVFVFVVTIYQGMDFKDSKTIATLLCAFAGSLFTYLMSVGLHPYIELMLNDDSVLVLNELSNPNHPLLKQLLVEAPGTYHHSMMVASLSANAVADIGGRSLLTRVACYYHDIGKIKHANFFVENLPDGAENPHNFLLPEDSKEIIFSHVSEGVKILEKENMPQLVIDICQQHHGTTLMGFFYAKAKERDPETQESQFRYVGPRPQTKEAGVVSLADTCEAAVRAMDHPTNEKIGKFVKNLIESRILDGQLDETGLTMKEIRIVEQSLINGLCSMFHSRIKYPKMKSEAEEMKKEQEERA